MGKVGDEESERPSIADSVTFVSCLFVRRGKLSAERFGGYVHVLMGAQLIHLLAFLDTISINFYNIGVSWTWILAISTAVK